MNKKDVFVLSGKYYSNSFDNECVHHFRDNKTGVEGYVFVDKDYPDICCMLFLPTDEILDIITDFLFCQKKYPYSGTTDIKMHGRYADAYLAVRDEIHTAYKSTKCSQVLCMGFSMGFGMANICALDMQYNFNLTVDKIGCSGSGPRVFNEAGQISYDKRVPLTIRYRYGNDVVSVIPFECMGFRSVGEYYHFGKEERWYRTNIFDHFQKYQIAREFFIGKANEL